jgi:hypothetical protein
VTLLKCTITFLTEVFIAVLCGQYLPPAWKQSHVVFMLKMGKDTMLLSSYRATSLLTVGRLFKKILLTRVLRAVKKCGLM